MEILCVTNNLCCDKLLRQAGVESTLKASKASAETKQAVYHSDSHPKHGYLIGMYIND